MIHWDRYIAIIGRITQRPEVWDQTWWHTSLSCGSTHCVMGWAQIDATGREYLNDVERDAWKWLGCTSREGQWISDGFRTLTELQKLAITQRFPWETQR